MAKRVQTQTRMNLHIRKITMKNTCESFDTAKSRVPTPQVTIGAQNNQKSDQASMQCEESMSRPGSSFSVYRPLPGIGQKWNERTSPDVIGNVVQDVSCLNIHELDRPHIKKKKLTKESDQKTEKFIFENHNVLQNIKPQSPDSKVNRSSSSINEAIDNDCHVGSHPRKITRRELRSIQLRQRRSSQMKLVPPEPPEGSERLLIAVRLPDGKRMQRFFLPSNAITDVIAFAENQVKESFSECDIFVSSVPKKKLLELKSSLIDCGIKDRTLLLLEERDEEEML